MMKRILLIPLLCVTSLFAAPKGFKPQKGNSTLSQDGNTTLIKSGNKAIIHWDSFSIDAQEQVHFQQADSHSRVLNRVMGKARSNIYGTLSSNGQVYLINPHGIYIGPNGRIEATGFVGSTLNLLDVDFWEGKTLFFHEPGKGSIQNLGTVHCPAGDIVLIARAIQNEGTLNAPSGNVAMAAGVEVLLKPEGDQRISILTDLVLPNGEKEIAIENLGEIEALTVELKSSKNPYEKAIRCSGTVTALTQKEENGRIFLVASHGKTTVDGALTAESGEIHVLGRETHLTESATLDVSGTQAGTILVGGDFQGANGEIPNATSTTVDPGATLSANGWEGDGGKVILWGEDQTHYRGYTSAQALGEQGDGGFVEISARGEDYLYAGLVSTLSQNGHVGELLLDPVDITVDNFAGVSTPALTTPNYTPGVNATVDSGNLATTLNGSSITLFTSGGGAGSGDVTFNLGPTWSSNTTLTVSADRSVIVNAGATIDGSNGGGGGQGSIVLNSGLSVTGTSYTGIQILGDLTTDTGSITLNGIGGDQATTDHSVDIDAGAQVTSNNSISITGDRNVLIQGATTLVGTTGTGSISITGTGTHAAGNNNFSGIHIDNASVSTVNGNLTMNGTGGEVAFNRGILINTDGTVESTGSGVVRLTGSADGAGGVVPNNKEGISIGTQAPNTLGTVRVTDGNLFMDGTGGNGFLSQGVEVNFGGAIRSTGTGNVNIIGRGGSTGGQSATGVVFAADARIEATSSGNIDIQGFGGGTGILSAGVKRFPDFGASGRIETQSGNITILAVGAPNGGTGCHGLVMEGASSQGLIQTNAGGSISITATGGGSTTSSGVFLDDAFIRTLAGGSITIDATGGGGSSSHGVFLDQTNGNTFITTAAAGGNISVTARGGSSGTNNKGVNLIAGADILSNTGNLFVEGIGGPNAGGSYGVSVTGTDSSIRAAGGGNVHVIGRAGGFGSEGIFLSTGGGIIANGAGTGFIETFSDLVMTNGGTISSMSNLTVFVSRDIRLSDDAGIGGSGGTTVRAGRDILMSGSPGASARIIDGTNLTVLAGRNFTMNASGNFGTLIAAANSLTIVVDNAFPSSPDIGPGFFSKDAFSQVLTLGGTVRIFTARQPLNNIQGEINTVTFTPGTQFIDTAQEQWNTYYPSAFGGSPFTIFYKDNIEDTITGIINDLMIANAQLSDLLPFFPRVRTPFEYQYVGEFCDYTPTLESLRCRPNFAPYGSFIFEDRVFWIGERWDASHQKALMDTLKKQYPPQ